MPLTPELAQPKSTAAEPKRQKLPELTAFDYSKVQPLLKDFS